MDSSITGGYENTGNVADVNKQVPYSPNTMDYQQDNYTTDSQVGPDGFPLAGDPYNVQHENNIYNPTEPLQHLSYQHQDQSLENITHQSYYPTQETHLQHSYIPEQPQLETPEILHTNNGIIEQQVVENVEEIQNPETSSTELLVEETVVQESNVYLSEPPVESTVDLIEDSVEEVDSSSKIEDQNNEQKTQNCTEPTPVQESVVEDVIESSTIEKEAEAVVVVAAEPTENNEKAVKDEEIIGEVIDSTADNVNVEPVQESSNEQVEEAAPVESVETVENPEFTELQTYQEITEVTEEPESFVVEEGTSVTDAPSQPTSLTDAPSEPTSLTDAPSQPTQEATESTENAEEVVTEEKKTKQRKYRKPVHDLPMHLIGHDMSKPVDSVPNGRALPKPRLGVKVPYRNLTSQIVTKAELENEVLERARAKEQAGKPDNKFARSLTQRLANRIAPEKTKKTRRQMETIENSSKSVEVADVEEGEVRTDAQLESHEPSNSVTTIDDSKIQNDDDLLAILEGEGEEMPVMTKEIQDSEIDDSSLKLLEREIALQQLQELPHQEPKERIIRPRFQKGIPLKPDTPQSKLKSEKSQNSSPPKSSAQTPTTSKSDTSSPKKPSPSDSSTKKSSSSDSSPKKSLTIDLEVSSPIKKPIEVEPQVKVNMVLKTYSRKRKPSDMPEFEMPSPKRSAFEDPDANDIYEKNDPLAIPNDVYITKSSRVIKKKVIWDPDDEQSVRMSKTPVKPAESSTSKVPSTSSTKVVKSTPEKTEKPEKKPNVPEKPKTEPKVVVKTSEKGSSEKVSTPKKSIVKNKSPVKSKRGMSEVDRLLMDEGAIKMLYDLKSTDDSPAKKKKDVYSVEKAEKELLKRANLLKNDLVQNTGNESQKTLRKKEGPSLTVITPPLKQPTPILERKMSKDSTRSSVHTPPRSPTFFSSQASMLIRRRSSSSMSSDDTDRDDVSAKVSKSPKKGENVRIKKQKKSITNEKRDFRGDKESKENDKAAKEVAPKAMKGVQYKSFTMRRSGKHVSIDLNYIDDKCHFTIQVLAELISALKKLEKDKDCNVVSITSTSKAYCLGLDYASLVSDNKTERTDRAADLAENVREFLLCLLHFPKILVAGIQGECRGLGVTMLSLFDMVIASDTATFRTPYASLGCLGEATFLLTYPNLNSSGLAAELLYANQTLKADEAFRRGLISKLCWPEKYKDTLSNFLISVSAGSRQSLETTKRQLRVNVKDQVEAAISDEVDILIQHWTSPECQEKFAELKQ